MSLSGGRGSVWLRQAGHGGTGGCDAGCRSAHVRFQDAELSGHQMGPQRHEGTLCNNTQGTSGGVAGALHLLLLLCVPVFTQSLPPPSFLFFSISPRPYVKLWRSGRTHATPQGRDDGAEPRLSDVTLIFILNTVGTRLPFLTTFSSLTIPGFLITFFTFLSQRISEVDQEDVFPGERSPLLQNVQQSGSLCAEGVGVLSTEGQGMGWGKNKNKNKQSGVGEWFCLVFSTLILQFYM